MGNDLLIYKSVDGKIKVDAIFKDETLWLSQKGMSKVFGVGVSAISKQLKNIFDDGELNPEVVISKMENTTNHGAIVGKTQTSEINMYNLDAIIAVGYRINSKKATEFRIWATKVLKEYMIKGFALNDERFIRGNEYDQKYFDELLKFRRKKLLNHSENISHKVAVQKAEKEYEKYRIIQDQKYISSMDKFYNKYLEEGKRGNTNENKI